MSKNIWNKFKKVTACALAAGTLASMPISALANNVDGGINPINDVVNFSSDFRVVDDFEFEDRRTEENLAELVMTTEDDILLPPTPLSTEIPSGELGGEETDGSLRIYAESEDWIKLTVGSGSLTFRDVAMHNEQSTEDPLIVTVDSTRPFNVYAEAQNDFIHTEDSNKTFGVDRLGIRLGATEGFSPFSLEDSIELVSNHARGADNIFELNFRLQGGVDIDAGTYRTDILFSAAQQ